MTATNGAPLKTVEKAVLAGEILATYAYVRFQLGRGRQLPDTVAEMRRRAATNGVRHSTRVVRHLPSGTVRTLTKLPTDSRCLMRSLVLLCLLARRGIETKLVIGVKTAPDFGAHAWIERDGQPLLPTGGGIYKRLLEA